MNTRRIILIVTITVVAALVLWFAYYAISPLFRNIEADEALPVTTEAPAPINDEQDAQTASAQVTGTAGHPASGTVRLVEADGKRYVRYENFKTINGPDIYVYLSKDIGAKEFVSLGKVKATEGNINYEIPADVDVSKYPYVLTWCKTFGVLFNSADLSQAR